MKKRDKSIVVMAVHGIHGSLSFLYLAAKHKRCLVSFKKLVIHINYLTKRCAVGSDGYGLDREQDILVKT
jgi:hypothetical protein